MSERLRASERKTFDMFGVDLEKGTIAAVKKPSLWKRIKRDVAAWSPEKKKLAIATSGATLAALTLGILVGRKSARAAVDKLGAAVPSGAPPSPSPAAATAHPGAALVVATPKKTPGILRAVAGKQGAQTALVPNGARVTVVSSAVADGYRWYEVTTPKGQGWMHGDILKAAGAS